MRKILHLIMSGILIWFGGLFLFGSSIAYMSNVAPEIPRTADECEYAKRNDTRGSTTYAECFYKENKETAKVFIFLGMGMIIVGTMYMSWTKKQVIYSLARRGW